MRILAAGLGRDSSSYLTHRLGSVQVLECPTWRTLMALRDSGPFALLVLAADGVGQDALDVLGQVRSKYDPSTLGLVFVVPPDVDEPAAVAAAQGLLVQAVLGSPADPEDVVRQVAQALKLSVPLLESHSTFETSRRRASGALTRRLDSLEQMVSNPEALKGDAVLPAVEEAQKLAEALRDNGQAAGGRVAWRLSEMLAARLPFRPPLALWLAEIRALSEQGVESADLGMELPRVLLVDRPGPLTDALASAVQSRGLGVLTAHDLTAAHQVLEREYPEVVVIDPSLTEAWDEMVTFFEAAQASTLPPQLMVWTAQGQQEARLASAQLGASIFLPKPASEDEVIAVVEDLLLAQSGVRLSTLVLSQDESTLVSIRQALATADIPCTLLSQPEQFWKTLGTLSPDVVVLDLDTTDVAGLDLVRMIRMDADWKSVPIVALSGRTDTHLLTAAYSAGADDCIFKPIVEDELVVRLTKRAQRLTVDSEGGALGRRRFVQSLLRLQRGNDCFSLGVLGLDSFQEVNLGMDFDSGDTVLRRVGRLLGRVLPEPHRLVRWCGDQFVVCLEGMASEPARQALDEAVEKLRKQNLGEVGGRPLAVTFSAGVAEYPRDGMLFDDLYRVGLRGLAVAKRQGRGRVVASSWFADPAYVREPVEVVLVHQDEDLVERLQRVLEARGYRVEAVTDHRQAWTVLTPASAARPGLVAVMQVDPRLSESISLLQTFGRSKTAEPVRVIAVLDQTSQETVNQAFEHGAWFVLAADDPFPLIVQRVREALART